MCNISVATQKQNYQDSIVTSANHLVLLQTSRENITFICTRLVFLRESKHLCSYRRGVRNRLVFQRKVTSRTNRQRYLSLRRTYAASSMRGG